MSSWRLVSWDYQQKWYLVSAKLLSDTRFAHGSWDNQLYNLGCGMHCPHSTAAIASIMYKRIWYNLIAQYFVVYHLYNLTSYDNNNTDSYFPHYMFLTKPRFLTVSIPVFRMQMQKTQIIKYIRSTHGSFCILGWSIISLSTVYIQISCDCVERSPFIP